MSEFTDDMEVGFMWGDIQVMDREHEWAEGVHTTKDGGEIKLKDMPTEHLKNTIKYFKDYDTSELEKELRRRDLPPQRGAIR